MHDVGHMLHGLTMSGQEAEEREAGERVDTQHELLGARWLAERFPEEVCAPVRLHVAAKRYLCAVDPGYFEGLSEASKQSLEFQGGPLSDDQAARFILGRFGSRRLAGAPLGRQGEGSRSGYAHT